MDDAYREYLAAGCRAAGRYALVSPQAAPMGLSGSHLADRPGSSLEFMDHREYQPGDDLRRIDWSAYARSDRLTVRLYRQEVIPHLDILIDGSRSMRLEGAAKDRAVLGLAALLATAADNAGFTHRTHLAAEGWRQVIGGNGPAQTWQDLSLDCTGSPADALEVMPPTLVPRGIRVFLSDLLWLGDPEPMLARLAQKAASVAVIQVLAEADTAAAQRGNLRLVDSETARELEVFVDATQQERYRQALARHQQNWSRAARQAGATLTTLVAERLIDGWNLGELVGTGLLKVIDS
jgi:uncharacterized protein (DUF58 family)